MCVRRLSSKDMCVDMCVRRLNSKDMCVDMCVCRLNSKDMCVDMCIDVGYTAKVRRAVIAYFPPQGQIRPG